MKLDILNTPLETFGESETQQLMDKYDGKTQDGEQIFTGDEDADQVNPYSVKNNPYGRKVKKQAGK